jgi:NADH-quinone oxidoreductase subunit G
VLRVLGSLLGLPGFDMESIDDVRAAVIPAPGDIAARISNGTRVPITKPVTAAHGFERVADVPIYFADPLSRRAPSLQQTADARPPRARMNLLTLQQIGVVEGAPVKVRQGHGEAVLTAVTDAAVPAGVVRIAAAHASTCGLEGLSGPITVERA